MSCFALLCWCRDSCVSGLSFSRIVQFEPAIAALQMAPNFIVNVDIGYSSTCPFERSSWELCCVWLTQSKRARNSGKLHRDQPVAALSPKNAELVLISVGLRGSKQREWATWLLKIGNDSAFVWVEMLDNFSVAGLFLGHRIPSFPFSTPTSSVTLTITTTSSATENTCPTLSLQRLQGFDYTCQTPRSAHMYRSRDGEVKAIRQDAGNIPGINGVGWFPTSVSEINIEWRGIQSRRCYIPSYFTFSVVSPPLFSFAIHISR